MVQSIEGRGKKEDGRVSFELPSFYFYMEKTDKELQLRWSCS